MHLDQESKCKCQIIRRLSLVLQMISDWISVNNETTETYDSHANLFIYIYTCCPLYVALNKMITVASFGNPRP